MTKFAPAVIVDGMVVIPPGWMWITAFAVHGCPWAVEIASTDQFRDDVKRWHDEQKRLSLKKCIDWHEREIERLERELSKLLERK